MLSSIHPLGERSRNNRWAVTVGAFTLGSVGAAAAIGALLGTIGSFLESPAWVVLAIVGLAGGLDLLGVDPPGPERQVNERWIDTLRGTVYGFGFGAQLGAGLATYVVSWGVYAVLVAELLSGSTTGGAIIGVAFGLGRAAMPLASGWVDRPSRLTAFHVRLASLARPVHLSAAAILVGVAVLAGIGA
jgi:sulfite exporter TauE/SafE